MTPAEKIEERIRAGKRWKANGSAPPQQTQPSDPFAWLEDYELTDTEAEQIADPTWVEPGLIPEGHVVAVAAKPNGGKTTILFHMACKWAAAHYTVVYIHADTNPADAKTMREIAQRHRVRYLTPDMKVGKGMRDVVDQLKMLADGEADLRGHVWLFDTLKKMGNVINKDSLRQLLMLFRKLSARGMTCVLLCHTNKYRNADGEYQFEGTGDLEADSDELIYFEPQENPDGTLTVSTRCAKRRAEIIPMTWDIHRDRTVTQRREYVDVAAQAARQAQREQDEPVIEVITELLTGCTQKQTEILTHCRDLKFTEKRVRAILKRYSGDLWRAEKPFQRGEPWRYELLNPPPMPHGNTGNTETTEGAF